MRYEDATANSETQSFAREVDGQRDHDRAVGKADQAANAISCDARMDSVRPSEENAERE